VAQSENFRLKVFRAAQCGNWLDCWLWLAEMSSAENGLILSGPSVNFAPAFFLWIERACP
jgi:hypothetical protein